MDDFKERCTEENFRRAIEETIAETHALGHPVYQSKDGYIVAIYPGNREVRLQKDGPDVSISFDE